MITKIDGKYHLVCDNCEEEAEETFNSFVEAVDYRRANGWKVQKVKDGWVDTCPECLKG